MTREELIRMALEAGFTADEFAWHDYMFDHFADLVAAAEREACAKVVEASPSYDWHKFACEAAHAIRARGQA